MDIKRLFILATILAATTALGSACSGGGSTDDRPQATAFDAIARSLESFRDVRSFQTSFNTTTEGEGFRVATDGQATVEAGSLIYAQMEIDSGDDAQQFDELLFASPDLYMKQTDGQWFVLSPWNQGQRPGELSDFSPNDLVIDYEDIASEASDVGERPEETIEGVVFYHYFARLDFEMVYPEAPANVSGEVEADFFLNKTDYLPRRVRIVTTYEFENSKLVEDSTFDFREYNGAIIHPARPAEARPWRDLQAPEALCAGEQLSRCLQTQTELEAVGRETCQGERRRICLVPLGQISPELVLHIAEVASVEYGLEVTIMLPKPLPEALVDDLRGQVEGSSLINHLGDLYRPEYDDPQVVLIGVTSVDMYLGSSHFRYTFGVHRVSGRYGVISSFRMDPKSFGDPDAPELLRERFRKYFLRDLGLLYFGYEEDDDPTSLLFRDLLSLDDLDRMEEPLPVPQ